VYLKKTKGTSFHCISAIHNIGSTYSQLILEFFWNRKLHESRWTQEPTFIFAFIRHADVVTIGSTGFLAVSYYS